MSSLVGNSTPTAKEVIIPTLEKVIKLKKSLKGIVGNKSKKKTPENAKVSGSSYCPPIDKKIYLIQEGKLMTIICE